MEKTYSRNKVKKITAIAVLVAIEVIFQFVAKIVQIGPVSLNLSLIPIAIGAILFGPFAGAFLGLINGIVIIFTDSFFIPFAPAGTIITSLIKCTVAAMASGYIYKLMLKKKPEMASFLASIIIPIINTGLFIIACFTILKPAIDANYDGDNVIEFVFVTLSLFNFLFELGLMMLLSPAISRIIKVESK